MIPLTVQFDEIPVVTIVIHRISYNHHVGNSSAIQEHFAACIISVAVSRMLVQSLLYGTFEGLVSVNRLVIYIRVYPVENVLGGLSVI